MGFLRRRKEARHADNLANDLALIREQIDGKRELFGSGEEFDLRALVDDLFAGKPVYSIQLLVDTFGVTEDEFWSGVNLDTQWDGQSREAREERLVTDIRLTNRLHGAEYDDAAMLKLHAALSAKVLVFAWDTDAVYGTDYSERLAADPLQFGVLEVSA